MPTINEPAFASFLALLRCPVCSSPLEFTASDNQPLPGGCFGVLSCGQHTYPVVDSIPIFQQGPVPVQAHPSGTRSPGLMPSELVTQITHGQCLTALTHLLTFAPTPLPFVRTRKIRRAFGLTYNHLPASLKRLDLEWGKSILERLLKEPLDCFAAEDWFNLFFRRSIYSGDSISYFFFRFGQPRHLAALSLMTLFPPDDKPILDLACGFGHLGHYLVNCDKHHSVIGFDRNFFQLWVGRRWVAPGAHFVCGDADQSLPFHDATLSGALCSDAFHLFQDKEGCLRELRRCAENGTLILARMGNKLQQPNEGFELTPEGYAELVSSTHYRLAGESELVDGYLRGLGPQLAEPTDPQALNAEKWLSLVVSESPEVFTDHGPFHAWPHGIGDLALNPIYRTRFGPDEVALKFHFPSSWYAFENARMTEYHPKIINISRQVYDQVQQGLRTPEVEELIERFVVLGLPARYLRAQIACNSPTPGESSSPTLE